MYGVTHFLHNQVKRTYEAVTPDPTKSHFEEKRVCTLVDFWLCARKLALPHPLGSALGSP
jgi:hypothetical protein